MLLIVELLFLLAGIWVIIIGKLPAGLFKFLFGKGEYELSTNRARLFGLLLLSPLPVTFFVSILLPALLGSRGIVIALIFEYVYIISVSIVSIAIARRARLPVLKGIDNTQYVITSPKPKIGSYRLRLLIVTGIVITGCITISSFGSLLMVAISSIFVGTKVTGNFWSDYFPFIIMIAITGIGVFVMVKLVQVLQKKA